MNDLVLALLVHNLGTFALCQYEKPYETWLFAYATTLYHFLYHLPHKSNRDDAGRPV